VAEQKPLPGPDRVRVEYSWDVYGSEVGVVEQKTSTDRVATRIRPHRIRITGRSPWRGGLHVYIEGITIKKDGSQGQQNRAVSYEDGPLGSRGYEPARDMKALPAWAQPYVDAVREWEAAEDRLAAVRGEIDHAAANDHRLDHRCIGVGPGEIVPAVRTSFLEAALTRIQHPTT
jgi:hypothetical protein